MIGAAIGLVFGLLQFVLLFKGVKSITSDHMRILPLLLQFFCPMAGLLLCVLMKREQLLPCAICIIAILLLGSVTNALIYARRSAGKKGFFSKKKNRHHREN